MTKKIIPLICCLFLSLSVFAQAHLTFMGIPITGSMKSFCTQLQSKGFSPSSSIDSHRAFKGKFTGRDVNVMVGSTDDGMEVQSVVVKFTKSDKWNVVNDTYSYYKEIYTKKYGEPSASVEEAPSWSKSNNAYLVDLARGCLNYYTQWTVSGGDIKLSIHGTEDVMAFVQIKYLDKQNMDAKIQNDLEDI